MSKKLIGIWVYLVKRRHLHEAIFEVKQNIIICIYFQLSVLNSLENYSEVMLEKIPKYTQIKRSKMQLKSLKRNKNRQLLESLEIL